jgi:hypothetical protein
VRAGDTPSAQSLRDTLRPDTGPDASDTPTPGGAVGSQAAEEYQPEERSGARAVRVPEPGEIRKDDSADQTGGAFWDAHRPVIGRATPATVKVAAAPAVTTGTAAEDALSCRRPLRPGCDRTEEDQQAGRAGYEVVRGIRRGALHVQASDGLEQFQADSRQQRGSQDPAHRHPDPRQSGQHAGGQQRVHRKAEQRTNC